MSFAVSWDRIIPRGRTDVDFATSLIRSTVAGIRETGVKRPFALALLATRTGVSERRIRRLFDGEGYVISKEEIGWLRAARARIAGSLAAWHMRRAEYWKQIERHETAAAEGRQLQFDEARGWKMTKPDVSAASDWQLAA